MRRFFLGGIPIKFYGPNLIILHFLALIQTHLLKKWELILKTQLENVDFYWPGVNIFLWEGAFYLVGYCCFDPQSAWYFAFCCKNSCRITNVHLLCLKQFKIIHSTHSYPSSSIPSAGFISFDFTTLKHFSLFYDK